MHVDVYSGMAHAEIPYITKQGQFQPRVTETDLD